MASNYDVDQQAIVNRLSADRVQQLTDDANAGTIDATKVVEAIDAAEAEFHLYASVYYTTPVRTSASTIPEGIREKLIEATAWRLTQRRSEALQGTDKEGKLWADRRKEILDWFEAIASSDPKKRLLIAGGVEKTSDVVVRSGTATVVSDAGRFTPSRMKGFF
jgi:phage gp36-like protein